MDQHSPTPPDPSSSQFLYGLLTIISSVSTFGLIIVGLQNNKLHQQITALTASSSPSPIAAITPSPVLLEKFDFYTLPAQWLPVSGWKPITQKDRQLAQNSLKVDSNLIHTTLSLTGREWSRSVSTTGSSPDPAYISPPITPEELHSQGWRGHILVEDINLQPVIASGPDSSNSAFIRTKDGQIQVYLYSSTLSFSASDPAHPLLAQESVFISDPTPISNLITPVSPNPSPRP
jgi:hypothetical protein